MRGVDGVKGYVVGLICTTALVVTAGARAAPFSVPPDKALVYVLQSETGNFANLLVSVNGRHVATLPANSWFAFAADPGVHLVSVAAVASAATRLQVEAGKTYYLEERVNAGGIPAFRAIPESQAQSQMARYRSARTDLVVVGAPLALPSPKATTKPQPQPQPQPAAKAAPAHSPVPDVVADATHFMLMAKLGSFRVSETSQNWFDTPATVDGGSSGVFSLEFGYLFGSGWSLGAEFFNFRNSWTQTDGSSGSFKTYATTVNGKKYFTATDIVRPFVGIGLGFAVTDFSGDIKGSSTGSAYHIAGGVEFRFKHIGAHLELKSLSADTKATRSTGETDKVNVSGRGIFAGVSGHF